MRSLALSALCCALTLPAIAQVATSEISGTITDTTGAVIPGAKVTATNVATNVAHQTTADPAGHYIIPLLPPGDYTVTVEAGGFRTLIQSGISLQIAQQAKLDLTMQVGAVSETLQVTAQAPLLQTQSSATGTVVNSQLVNQLPLNGRNFIQLAILSPGVNGVGFSASGTIMSGSRPDDRRPGTEIFSNGNREGSNNFLYDGIDDNERLTLSIVLRPAVEAVREFKIETNMYSADIGRNSGAVVDVITKSGTNDLHGSLFEFLRNSDMDARNFFNPAGTPFPSFKLNQFGGSLGGPVVIPKLYHGKNRTFFFFDYEGYRRTSQQLQLGNVPTPLMRQGNFSQTAQLYDPATTQVNPNGSGYVRTPFPGNIIPSGRFDPISYKMINAYPMPNNGTGRFNNYLANLVQAQNWDQGDIRIDHQISNRDTFFARYSIQDTYTLVPSTYPATQIAGISMPVDLSDEASFAGTSFTPDQHAVASWAHIFSPKLVNEFRSGFSRFKLDYTAAQYAPGAALGNQLGVPNSNVTPQEQNLPIFSPANYLGIGQTRSLPIFRRENTFEEVDNMTATEGAHTLKWGIDFRRRQLTIYQTNQGNGRFNFTPALTDSRQPAGAGGDSMASFLLGYPELIAHDYTLAWPGERGFELGTYFADDWRVTTNLTLNLGLRWDYYSPYSEVANRFANFNINTGHLDIAGQNGVGGYVGVQPYYKDFGPRFGFAYQVLSHTVIRGGFGLFYNPTGSEAGTMRLFRNPPFGITLSNTQSDIFPGGTVSQGFPALPSVNFSIADNPTGTVFAIDPNFRPSYAEQFNLTVEHQLPSEIVLKAAMVGNLGRHLYNTYNLNQGVPGPTAYNTRRPYYAQDPSLGDVSYFITNGLSEYYAFQFTMEKRFSNGISAILGYVWSHDIDDVPLEFGGGPSGPVPQDPRNIRADRGNSDIDMRHRLTLSYLWELPFGKGKHFLNHVGPADWVIGGWQTNGILTIQSGLPFSPVLNTSTTNGTSSRADVVGPITYPHTLQQWFNPAAFGTPAPYTYGNAGRDILFGPGRFNWDMSLFKDFVIHEQTKFEFRAEAFNVFNHPQFNLPNASIGNPQAGQITSTVGNPRQLQMGLRFQF